MSRFLLFKNKYPAYSGNIRKYTHSYPTFFRISYCPKTKGGAKPKTDFQNKGGGRGVRKEKKNIEGQEEEEYRKRRGRCGREMGGGEGAKVHVLLSTIILPQDPRGGEGVCDCL